MIYGRPGGIRTPNIRFWRPALYQLELLACIGANIKLWLLRFLVRGVFATKTAKLAELKFSWSCFFVFGCRVISLFAHCATEGDYISHKCASFCTKSAGHEILSCQHTIILIVLFYSTIEATTPAPTVRPPSRMAKRRPSSMAIGVIRLMVIATLSPGITISIPAGNSAMPVTSVVRK